MSINYIAKCIHCDYSVEYNSDSGEDYRYHGLSKHSKYPKIEYAWCSQCNKFVPIQLGINMQEQKELIKTLYNELIDLEKKVFKTADTRIKIELTKVNLFDTVILNSLTDGYDTQTSCAICGNRDVVFKDIKNQIWRCPKCKVGFLTLTKQQDNNDDVLYRRGERFISPVKRNSHINDYIIPKIILCSLDILNNESVFYSMSNNKKMLTALSKNTSFIDRIALTYAVLIILLKFKIPKEQFVLDVLNELIESDIITEDIKHLVIERFDGKIEFFKSEIEIELQCSSFIPSAIIKTLENSSLPSTREITGISPLETLKHWKIISDTIQGYFKYA